MKYRDRNGIGYEKTTTQDRFLRILYASKIGRCFLGFATGPFLTDLIGRFMNSAASSLLIDRFVRKNGIVMSDYVPRRYRSYNDFFTRKIKSRRRPVDFDPSVLISPCDGKLTAYRISPSLVMNIKNNDYSVKSILRNHELSTEFMGGWCLVIRLSVDNYHRYAYPDSGYKSDNVYLPGWFHTVNPVALEHASVFAENSREYTVIDTENFGRIIQMEVGALGVGRIVNRKEEGYVHRGAEKGYFEFGGSTVILFLKSENVIPDADLIRNTAEGYETVVKLGERIGKKA